MPAAPRLLPPDPDCPFSRRCLLRSVRFLLPGTSGRFRCGGLQVELQTARLISRIREVDIVTYRQREPDHPYLSDVLRSSSIQSENNLQELWVVSWGFDVPKLLRKLKGRQVAYHAHSSGYGFDLPAGTPILAVSRNTLGYWGNRAPRNPCFLVPNALEVKWLELGQRPNHSSQNGITKRFGRSIDVLVQQRKCSRYVLEQLVPALRHAGLNVYVQSEWVDDLVALFNQSTVYLYDSADYWRCRGVSEGFGLPPLEAMACGCVVFSSINHALADLLDPGFFGHQIGFGTLRADVERIVSAVREPGAWIAKPEPLEDLLRNMNEENLLQRWKLALESISALYHTSSTSCLSLQKRSILSLRCQSFFDRLRRTVNWLNLLKSKPH